MWRRESFILSSEGIIQSIVKLHACPSSCIRIPNPPEFKGHLSALRVEYSNCNLDFFMSDHSRKKTTFREGKQLNKTFNYTMNLVGLDVTGLKKLCAVLGIDGPPDSYHSLYQDELHTKLNQIMITKLEENRLQSHTRS